MKGCARSCLLLLLGWGAASYAHHAGLLRPVRVRDQPSALGGAEAERGDASAVAGRLRRRMINYFIGALACSAIVCAIVWLYRNNV